VERYGRTDTVYLATVTCLWYGVFRARTVRVVLLREAATTRSRGYDLALVTTDTDATPSGSSPLRRPLVGGGRDLRQQADFGVGQARNRTPNAVRRTVPFGLCALTLTIVWYALHGHHPDDAADHRARSP
jgi:hypothetical protein